MPENHVYVSDVYAYSLYIIVIYFKVTPSELEIVIFVCSQGHLKQTLSYGINTGYVYPPQPFYFSLKLIFSLPHVELLPFKLCC